MGKRGKAKNYLMTFFTMALLKLGEQTEADFVKEFVCACDCVTCLNKEELGKNS